MVGSVDPGPAQHLPLVEDGLSHTAFADQAQAAIVDKNAHVCLLYRSAVRGCLYPSQPVICWNSTVSPRLYRAMERGLPSRMMVVNRRQVMEVVPAR